MARLDRLADVREVAQIGACIGREFPYELLSQVARLPAEQLHSSLRQLADADLLLGHGTGPDAIYSFIPSPID